MPKPTTLTGWWLRLLEDRAGGSVMLLANLIGVTARTLGRYASGEIELPKKEQRIKLRALAGEDLLNAPGCPKYLRLKPKKVTHAK